MRPDRVRATTLTIVRATPATLWILLDLETEEGWRGAGEATLAGGEEQVAAAFVALAGEMMDAPLGAAPTGLCQLPSDLPHAAARSAFDHALWEVAARRQGRSLAEALGPVRRTQIPVYANINRSIADRSATAFADRAAAAVLAGHQAVKLAPFDEVNDEIRRNDDRSGLKAGLMRVGAVREAIGPGPRLMVDCHWRLTPDLGALAIDRLAELGVDWIECPLPETMDTMTAIVRLRHLANARGIALAGLETAIGVAGFRAFLQAGAYDVMMPDVKYVGGLAEMLRLAEELDTAGVGFSPHNPSGPVCHAISLQICAVVETLHSLEVQFEETPVFAALLGRDLQSTHAGAIALPTGPGLGAVLQAGVLDHHRVGQWTVTRRGVDRWEQR